MIFRTSSNVHFRGCRVVYSVKTFRISLLTYLLFLIKPIDHGVPLVSSERLANVKLFSAVCVGSICVIPRNCDNSFRISVCVISPLLT